MDDRGTGTAGIRILVCDSEEESETVSGARISARPENNKRCNYVWEERFFQTWLHLFCVMELLCKGSGCIILEDCYNEAVLRWGWF